MCKTKPICPGAGNGGRVAGAGRPRRRATMKNEPNFGRPIVQNEPNFRRAEIPTIPLFHYSTLPAQRALCKTNPISGYAGAARPQGRGPPGNRAKQSQTWENWGILGEGRRGRTKGKCHKQTQFWPRQCEGQVVYGKGVTTNLTCK